MTEQELKNLAREKGYYLVKKQTRKTKLLPCRCGSKRPQVIRGAYDYLVRCRKCQLKTPWIFRIGETRFETEEEARKYWNDMVSGEKEEELDGKDSVPINS